MEILFLPPANEVCEGYVFTRVCHSVHGGRGVLSHHALQVVSQHALQQVWGVVSQHALQVSRPTPRGELRGSGLGGLQAHTWGGCACSRGVCSQGGVCGEPIPSDTYCCGWYASYWNAFFYSCFEEKILIEFKFHRQPL